MKCSTPLNPPAAASGRDSRPPTRPDFLILGAQKAGTTALYHALARHGGVRMSPVKEARFFLGDGRAPSWRGPGSTAFVADGVWDPADYAALFAGAHAGMPTGEATPAYLAATAAPAVAGRIARFNPAMRLIVLLRNPAERAFSAFLHHRRLGYEPERDFARALEREESRLCDGWLPGWGYRRNGRYAECLRPFLGQFPRSQLLLLAWEDWHLRPEPTFRKVCRFLDVEEHVPANLAARHNESWLPRVSRLARWNGAPRWLRRLNSHRPRIDPGIRQRLLADYAEATRSLDRLCGTDFATLWS